MTPRTWRGLAAIGRSLPPGVRVVVIRGKARRSRPGSTCGCSVAKPWRARTPLPEPRGPGLRGLDRLPARRDSAGSATPRSCRWPRCTGTRSGPEFQLALACDLRVLADDARLSMREPTLGLVPDLLGTKPLVDMVGLPRALELCLTGRSVAAAGGTRSCGSPSWWSRSASSTRAVGDLVAAILAAGPDTARATKELLARAPGHTAGAAGGRRAAGAGARSSANPLTSR